MGNCLRRESSMRWGGEDWGSPAVDHRVFPGNMVEVDHHHQEEGFLKHHEDGDDKKDFFTTSSYGSNTNYSTTTMSTGASTTEVKIKITKKQLEELLGKADVKDMSVQQVLAQLISVSDRYQTQQIRSWRPALQSIPEVN